MDNVPPSLDSSGNTATKLKAIKRSNRYSASKSARTIGIVTAAGLSVVALVGPMALSTAAAAGSTTAAALLASGSVLSAASTAEAIAFSTYAGTYPLSCARRHVPPAPSGFLASSTNNAPTVTQLPHSPHPQSKQYATTTESHQRHLKNSNSASTSSPPSSLQHPSGAPPPPRVPKRLYCPRGPRSSLA